MSRKGVSVRSADGYLPVKKMTLTGVVPTNAPRTNGRGSHATVVVEMTPDGEVLSVRIGRSQAYAEFVDLEHKRLMLAARRAS